MALPTLPEFPPLFFIIIIIILQPCLQVCSYFSIMKDDG